MRNILLLLACLTGSFLFAQSNTATLSGKITDAKTKEALIGVSILLEGTSTGTVTDMDGNFKLENLPLGQQKFILKYISYASKTVEVLLLENTTNTLNTSLSSEEKAIREVVVKETKRRNTENAVVAEIRKANSIVSGVSAAQIQKSQDRSAADVVKRIPGVTVVDGRFINIRGLNERYNNVFLNDAAAPSSEADKRAFSFDVLPSGMIERIMIYKTPSAELPGDFAGGMVKIYTSAMPEKNAISLSYNTSFREGSTFKPFAQTAGSKTDLLGFDNGSRNMATHVPNYVSKNDSNIASITKSFKNTWGIQKAHNAIPDQRAAITLQGVKKFSKVQIGNTFSLNYALTQSTFYVARADYDSTSQNSKLSDTVSTRQVNVGIMENFALRFGNHTIEFKNLLNQIGRQQTTRRGNNFNEANDLFYAEYYQARTNVLTQLSGTHLFHENKTTYNWNLSYNLSSKTEPDFKRIKYSFNPADSSYKAPVANVVDPVNGGGRFYSKLKERIVSFNQNFHQKIAIKKYTFELSAGSYVEYKSRSFQARILGYTIKSGSNAYRLTRLDLEHIFDTANVGGVRTFRMDEITSMSDAYQAQNLQIAPYVNFTFPFGKWAKLVAGVRYEFNKQSLQSHVNLDSVSPSITTHFVLPSANLAININEKMLVRLAGGMNVNRPEFREWSPFYFYDFELNAGNYGSLFPTVFSPQGNILKVAKIGNIDLRYEYYPAAGDMIHVGGFYKYFKNPIQQVITPTGGSDSKGFTYINGDHAVAGGVELDMRKNLGFIGESLNKNEFKNFTFVFNAAYIYSKLTMPNLPSLNRTSALQGQSPYIFNAGLFYQNDTLGLQASLLYNVFGPRIYIVGSQYYPNIGEMPKQTLDLSLAYTIKKKITFTFAVQDILNQASRYVLDIDRNGKFEISKNSKDKEIRSMRTGRYISLGVKVKF